MNHNKVVVQSEYRTTLMVDHSLQSVVSHLSKVYSNMHKYLDIKHYTYFSL